MRECLVKKVVARLSAIGAAGLNLDLEELQPEDSENFLEFAVALRAALHAHSMRLTVDVPFHDPAFDFEYIGDIADAVMVMAYDQHYPGVAARTDRARTWLKESYDEVLGRLPPDRVVVVPATTATTGPCRKMTTSRPSRRTIYRSAPRWTWRAPPARTRRSKSRSRTDTSVTSITRATRTRSGSRTRSPPGTR